MTAPPAVPAQAAATSAAAGTAAVIVPDPAEEVAGMEIIQVAFRRVTVIKFNFM